MDEDKIEGMFVNDTVTALAEVVEVNESFARLEIRQKSSSTQTGGLASSYAMPIGDYDSKFSKLWKPATLSQARQFFTPAPSYRPPADTSGWS